MLLHIIFILTVVTSITYSQVDSLITYYNNGNIKSIIYYNNGVRDGEAISYRKDGKIKQELSYFNGRVEGLVSNYDENGVLREMFNILDGKREGPASYFDSASIFIKDVFYTEGYLDIEEELLTYSKFDDVLASNETNIDGKQLNKNKKKVNTDQLLPPVVEDDDSVGSRRTGITGIGSVRSAQIADGSTGSGH